MWPPWEALLEVERWLTSRSATGLKLAGWFTDSTPGEAHTLFNAAIATYGSRHLGGRWDEELSESDRSQRHVIELVPNQQAVVTGLGSDG
jgi:hypothetical protein